jgi:hypothetical protein
VQGEARQEAAEGRLMTAKLAAAIHRLNMIVPVDMDVTGAQQITIVSSFLRSHDGGSLVNMVMSWPWMPQY